MDLNGLTVETTLTALDAAIADAERRTGQHILSGGKSTDKYVERQREVILSIYEKIKELKEMVK